MRGLRLLVGLQKALTFRTLEQHGVCMSHATGNVKRERKKFVYLWLL